MAKNNNTLVFNGLMQGMSWDLIKEAKDEIKRHLREKQPTRKDILTDWIIGKDYMLQLQGNIFEGGGEFEENFEENPDESNPWKAILKILSLGFLKVNEKKENEPSKNDIMRSSGLFEGINKIAAPAVGGVANSLNYNDYWGNSSYVNKAAYGDSSADPLTSLFENISGTGLKRAKDEIETKRQGNILNLNYGDNASLMSQIEAYNRSKTGLLSQLGDLTIGGGITDFLNSTGLGALHGTTVLPGWGTLGGAILGSASWIGNALFENANKKKLNALILDANNDLIRNDLKIAYTVNNNQLLNTFNQLQHMTSKGGKLNKSHKFAEGGLLNTYDYGLEEVNAGGSHEENPNEGVVVSYAPDGLPNKVEEGETIHNDYVYSKRLEANEKVLKNNLLDEKYEGKSFADISKKLTEDRKQRPNDPISVRTNEENLNRLQGALEELKLDNKTREVKRFLGSLNNDLLNALQLEMMDEYEAYAELLAQQLEQEDLAYQEELAALEGMFGKGGHLFLTKGKIRYLGEDIPYYYNDYISAYYNGTNPTTFMYHDSKDNKDYYSSLFGLGWNVGDASILPYGKDNNITFTDSKNDKIKGGVPVLNGKRMSNKEQRNLVKRVLNDLVRLGYDIKVDGLYGPKTITAILHLARLNPEYEKWKNSREEKGLPVDSYNYYVDFIQNNGNLVPSLNLRPLTASSNTDEISIVPRKDIPEVSKVPNIKVRTEGNSYSSLAPLRFAEAFGSAGLYLSDILGLTNQPDYSNARMYQRAVDNIGGVNFTPIGNYLTYTPIDTEYITNQQMATAAARRNYGNVVGNYTLGLLNNYNTLNQIGATAIAARQQDLEQKSKVAEFNRATNDRNSAMSLDAQKQNAALRALRALEYRYLADMMTKERDTNEAARAANYQNFMSNLAAIGREDFNYDQIKWMIDHGVFPVGVESYLTRLKI